MGWVVVELADEGNELVPIHHVRQTLEHRIPGNGVVSSDAIHREDRGFIVHPRERWHGMNDAFSPCPGG